MALDDFFSNFHLLIRWFHVIAGIVWIGHLYFFNFVNIPFQASLDDVGKKNINPKLMPRALWWFRWGAMTTFIAGLILFTLNYMYAPEIGFGPTSLFLDPEGGISGRAWWIMLGMVFATIMWVNVWFVIWPAQKKILSGTLPPEHVAPLRTRAGKASRINTYLSAPMLFGMLAPAHYGAFNWLTALIAIALGMVAIWFSYRTSLKVGTSV